MDTRNITNKMQRAYQSMVDSLEELVDIEGKNLKEALELAQQRLTEWGELSREEVVKVSNEVKQDLGSLGKTLREARQSFRDNLAQDAEYLKETSLDKLDKIADKTMVELAEFMEVLNTKVKEAVENKHEIEHHAHQKWDREHAMWLDDITLWHKEHQQAEEKLLTIQDSIRQQSEALQEHAQTIRAHQAREHEHEVTMADVEQNMNNKKAIEHDTVSEQAHEQLQHVHENQAKLHQEIKQKHKKTIVLVEKLYKKVKELS